MPTFEQAIEIAAFRHDASSIDQRLQVAKEIADEHKRSLETVIARIMYRLGR